MLLAAIWQLWFSLAVWVGRGREDGMKSVWVKHVLLPLEELHLNQQASIQQM